MNTRHIGVITILALKRIWNRKFAMGVIVFAPVMLCISFGYVAYKSPENLSTLIVTEGFKQIPGETEVRQLAGEIDDYQAEDGSKPFSTVVTDDTRAEALRMLDEGKTRAVVVLNRGGAGINSADVIRDVTEPSVGKRFEQELPNIFIKYSKDLSVKRISEFLAQHNNLTPQAANENAEKAVAQCDITFTTNAWQELKFFDYFASSSIVLIALCLSLFLSAIAITEERSIGTLERVFATPYQKSEIIIGRMLAYNILAVVMAVLIIITLKVVFDATLGNIWLILLLTFLVAVNGVIFGLLISSITSSETESLLLAMLFILLFILQMTYLWPWETMHPVARFVSYMMPYTYGYQAICRVNMLGAGFADVWLDLVILVGFILVQAVIATLVLRREIK